MKRWIRAALAAGLFATSLPAIAAPANHLAPATLPAIAAGDAHPGVILAQYHRHHRHCWWRHHRRYCR